ncbi:hypothetical protein OSS47_01690 [Pseudomonas citronellolis]|uniref:hypothetical protein n=1 Tax=Pseudomonas citronellolis TaxID=53408 RepID=UPI00226FCA61|nr:hypothetical protein [Pseudomonas citronellolis]WAB92725.1 hypothetical protein OSS47_01690 [Pseudomonas citronellolis]
MRQHSTLVESDKDKIIDRLRDDLWMLRSNLIHLLPYETVQILSSYHGCLSRKDTYQWLDQISEKIIAYAQPLETKASGWGSRANCPLCGRGADSPYQEGFALPEGLRRHLVGYGNTHQCLFTEVAEYLARDHWRDKFAESERLEREAEQKELVERRSKEALYQLDPFDGGHLLDEGISYGEKPRHAEDLDWAESRLHFLGMEKKINGNIQSWVDDRETFVVYADVRSAGRINFSVWKKPLPKRPPSNTYRYRLGYFYLLDNWKNNLKSKYESRLPNT